MEDTVARNSHQNQLKLLQAVGAIGKKDNALLAALQIPKACKLTLENAITLLLSTLIRDVKGLIRCTRFVQIGM